MMENSLVQDAVERKLCKAYCQLVSIRPVVDDERSQLGALSA
jgi:hypothetical protein